MKGHKTMTTLTDAQLESLMDRANARAETERIARERGITPVELVRLILDAAEKLRAEDRAAA